MCPLLDHRPQRHREVPKVWWEVELVQTDRLLRMRHLHFHPLVRNVLPQLPNSHRYQKNQNRFGFQFPGVAHTAELLAALLELALDLLR